MPLKVWLNKPENLPSPTRSVKLIETHISLVFVADEHVYKLKKPVEFEFLDFSTIDARRQACEDELRLNRRLAPQVYLEVLPVYRKADGTPTWEATGEPIDWVVHMRRLPEQRMMEDVIRAGEITDGDCQAVVRMLAAFYRSLPGIDLTPEDYRQRIEAHVRGNFDDMIAGAQHLPALAVKRITASLLRMLKLESEGFDARVKAGRVIEGHGDLRPEHVCLIDPPVVFDCIEFSQDFRTIDVADELSFLAMECDLLKAGELGQRLIEQTQAALADDVPPRLSRFYKAYRACVRSKVAALRSVQLEGEAEQAAHDEAEAYLKLAEGYTEDLSKPLVIVVAGRMGTGKSTLAKVLAEEFTAEVVQTDAVRRELLGASDEPAEYGEGNYTPENKRRVYRELGRRIGEHVAQGLTAIADGTFLSRSSRAGIFEAANTAGARIAVVRCDCPDEVALKRIAERETRGTDLSEARPELLKEQSFEPPGADEPGLWVEVDTTRPLDEQVATVLSGLQGQIARE
ncbi:unnamed protein product [Cladocopium goreaui]|uniref:Uncharacterized protein Mb2027c n=1 Tax=Cladocopium goreaui TaxID=2562237 RepID=A0A9P1FCS9_9DINO|nr:unnamed protein product [Cladocopium goreaui]